MKKLFVFALAAAAIVGCNKSENGGNDSAVDQGQAQQLKVLTSISTQTRTAVDGVVLPKGSEIGVHVVTGTPEENNEAIFVPAKTSAHDGFLGNYYDNGKNVRFENATGVNTWTSTAKDGNAKLLLFSGEETARVYGYYPYTDDANLNGVGANATVPVTIQNTGTITVGNEADPSTGSDNNADAFDDKLAYTAPEEIDYMYDATEDPANKVGAKTTTTANLTLKHALSRVSFRMYVSADAQQAVQGEDQADSKYKFVGYVIKNKSGQSELKASTEEAGATMNISNGTIAGDKVGGEISRTIEGYIMKKAEKNDTDQDAADKAAADDSYRVSNLMFPHATLTATADDKKTDKIEVVFMIARVDKDGVASEPVGHALPFAVEAGQSDKWEAGKNYTYTVKFTGNALSIETVTVTDWVEVVGGNMEIE